MLYALMCVRRQAPRRELPKGIISMKPQAASLQWAPKELKMVLTQFKNGSIYTQMQTPNARESPSKLTSLTRRVGKGVSGIQKWVPFTPKCSQKRWRLGLRPRLSNSEGGRLWRLPIRNAEGSAEFSGNNLIR